MPLQTNEKPLHWVGSSKKDLLSLPPGVVDDFGYALGAVQMGATPPQAKPWKGEGAAVCTALLSEKVAQRHPHGTRRYRFDPRAPQGGAAAPQGAL